MSFPQVSMTNQLWNSSQSTLNQLQHHETLEIYSSNERELGNSEDFRDDFSSFFEFREWKFFHFLFAYKFFFVFQINVSPRW